MSNSAGTSSKDKIISGNKFPAKLWKLINSSSNHSSAKWSDNGKTITVDTKKFQDRLRSDHNFFKTSHLSSFIRQLNLYGFRKVNMETDYHKYSHRYFKKGRPDLLSKVRRILNSGSTTKHKSSQILKKDKSKKRVTTLNRLRKKSECESVLEETQSSSEPSDNQTDESFVKVHEDSESNHCKDNNSPIKSLTSSLDQITHESLSSISRNNKSECSSIFEDTLNLSKSLDNQAEKVLEKIREKNQPKNIIVQIKSTTSSLDQISSKFLSSNSIFAEDLPPDFYFF